jgi:hypothetical protein
MDLQCRGLKVQLLLACILASLTLNALAGTYYVSPSGNDANAGTLAAPWRTVEKAIAMAQAGDTVLFREGTYRQTRVLGLSPITFRSGTATARIAYKGYPGETAIITPARAIPGTGSWTRVGSTNVYYAGLTPQVLQPASASRIPMCTQNDKPLRLMVNYGSNGTAANLNAAGQWVCNVSEGRLYVWSFDNQNPGVHNTEIAEFIHGDNNTIFISHGSSNFLTFENLTIEGGYYAICIGSDDVQIKNCTIRNAYGEAVKVWGETWNGASWSSERGLVQGCNIYNFGGVGIDCTGGDYWTLSDNNIHDGIVSRLDGSSGSGLMVKNNSVGVTVERNRITDLKHAALFIGGQSLDAPFATTSSPTSSTSSPFSSWRPTTARSATILSPAATSPTRSSARD